MIGDEWIEGDCTLEFSKWATGDELKAEGQDRAESGRYHLVMLARGIAKDIAKRKGSVTTDDIRVAEPWLDLGQAWGCVFRGHDWEFTGQFVKSVIPSNHARLIRVWKLR